MPIDSEDFGAVVLRMGDRTRGAFTASQVNAGCKNRLQIEVFGTKAGAIWSQERPDELWIGRRNEYSQVVLKDPSILVGDAKTFADIPGGHSEGYDDAQKQKLPPLLPEGRQPRTLRSSTPSSSTACGS